MKKINEFINNCFFDDYYNWVLWIPVIFSFGILSYFEINYNNTYLFYFSIYSALFFLIKFYKNTSIRLFIFSFLLFAFGYMRALSYVNNMRSPILKCKVGTVEIYGIIEDLSYYQKFNNTKKRITVKVRKIEKYKKSNDNNCIKNEFSPYFSDDGFMQNLPKYVRININNKTYKPKFGDYVVVRANLIPIPSQSFVGAYNPQKEFFFQQIGAIGYNGYVEDYRDFSNHTFFEKMRNKAYNVRENIDNRIIEAIGEDTGAIVSSFITGIRGKINSDDINSMTYAGLAHLIAISGLNMSIIMGLFFVLIRRILVQSEYIALNFNIKKISAFLTIIVGFLYLSITGFPVSANRAYLMSCLFFVAILINRESDTMRFLCFAALLIIFLEPELILSPSFQLSFFAVIGLVGGVKFLKSHNIKLSTNSNFKKPFYYIFATLVSSLLAEISVSPISIYYFNNYTTYNIIANIVAIPVSGFITLPLATFSILLFPFNLEKYLLIPAGWSIDLIVNMSKYIVSLPGAVHIVSSPSILGLSLIVFGFLWFMLLEQKWRYFGVFLYLVGIAISVFKAVPNVIIDTEDKFIVIVDKNGDLYFSETKNNYKKETIVKKLGEVDYKPIDEYLIIDNLNEEIENIFRNKDIIENFRTFEARHNIFKKDYDLLINPPKSTIFTDN